MRATVTVLLGLLLMGYGLAGSVAGDILAEVSPSNILVNPSFEGGSGNSAVAWESVKKAGNPQCFVAGSDKAHSGNRCVAVRGNYAGPGTVNGWYLSGSTVELCNPAGNGTTEGLVVEAGENYLRIKDDPSLTWDQTYVNQWPDGMTIKPYHTYTLRFRYGKSSDPSKTWTRMGVYLAGSISPGTWTIPFSNPYLVSWSGNPGWKTYEYSETIQPGDPRIGMYVGVQLEGHTFNTSDTYYFDQVEIIETHNEVVNGRFELPELADGGTAVGPATVNTWYLSQSTVAILNPTGDGTSEGLVVEEGANYLRIKDKSGQGASQTYADHWPTGVTIKPYHKYTLRFRYGKSSDVAKTWTRMDVRLAGCPTSGSWTNAVNFSNPTNITWSGSAGWKTYEYSETVLPGDSKIGKYIGLRLTGYTRYTTDTYYFDQVEIIETPDIAGNGGFEEPTLADGAMATGPGVQGGWTLTASTVAIYNPTGDGTAEGLVVEAGNGNNYLRITDDPVLGWDLTSAYSWSQDVTIKANHTYTLRFRYGKSSDVNKTWTRCGIYLAACPTSGSWTNNTPFGNTYYLWWSGAPGWQTWEYSETILPGDSRIGQYIGVQLEGHTFNSTDAYYFDKVEMIETDANPAPTSNQIVNNGFEDPPITDGGNTGSEWGLWYTDEVYLIKDASYRLSGWVKTEGVATGDLFLPSCGYINFGATPVWTQVQGDFVAGATGRDRLALEGYGLGIVYFDDVSVQMLSGPSVVGGAINSARLSGIVLPDSSNMTEISIAMDTQDVFKKMTGVNLPILKKSQAPEYALDYDGGFETPTLADGATATGPGTQGDWYLNSPYTAIYNPTGNGTAEGLVVEEGFNYLKIADDPNLTWDWTVADNWPTGMTIKANHTYTLRFRYGKSSDVNKTWTRCGIYMAACPTSGSWTNNTPFGNTYYLWWSGAPGWKTWEYSETILPGDSRIGQYIGVELAGHTWNTTDAYYFDQVEVVETRNISFNGGFETPTLADGATAVGPGTQGGWYLNTSTTAIYNPTGDGTAEGLVIEEGSNYLSIKDDPNQDWSTTYANRWTSETIKAGYTYTLRFRYGKSSDVNKSWARCGIYMAACPTSGSWTNSTPFGNSYYLWWSGAPGWKTWEYSETILPGDFRIGMYVGLQLEGHTFNTTDAYYFDQVEITETPSRFIYIGRAAESTPYTTDLAAVGDEGMVLNVTPKAVVCLGNTPRGLYYAAQELFYTLGCRWYTPWDGGECIPYSTSLTIPSGKLIEQPSFSLRGSKVVHAYRYPDGSVGWLDTERWSDWAARNRMNGLTVGGMKFNSYGEIRGYDYQDFCGHTLQAILLQGGRTLAKYPLYYPLVDGVRTDVTPWANPPRPANVCVSNEEVIDYYADFANEYFDKYPYAERLMIDQEDVGAWCEDANCKALDPPGVDWSKKQSTDWVFYGMQDRWMWFINRVAEKVAKKHPGKYIGTFAYADTATPPTYASNNPRSNVMIEQTWSWTVNWPIPYGPWESVRCWKHNLGDPTCPYNYTNGLGMFNLWSPLAPISIYTYYRRYDKPYMPESYCHADADFYNTLYGLGVRRVADEWDTDVLAAPLLLNLRMRLLWDKDVNVDQYIDDFCTKVYGVAAVPVKQYFQAVEQVITGSANTHVVYLDNLLTLAKCTELESYLTQAETAAGSDTTLLGRIARLRISVYYARIILNDPSSQAVKDAANALILLYSIQIRNGCYVF